jgi:hypothetical protein
MIGSIFCFFLAFVLQGIIVASIMNYFEDLSYKRRRKSISDGEKWIQGVISVVAEPILEIILDKDPAGMRLLISICLGIATAIAIIFASADGFIIICALILLATTWLSMPR